MISHRAMLAGIALGAAAGLTLGQVAGDAPWLAVLVERIAQPIGQVFLRLLFMLVIPIIFSALGIGIADLELRDLGRIGLRTLAYTVVISGIAVVIGLTLVNALEPGAGASEDLRAMASATGYKPPVPSAAEKGLGMLISMVPDNPVRAAASGDMLGVLVFSLFFGVGLALTPGEAARHLKESVRGLYDVSMRLIGIVLKIAPLGVAALVFAMTARLGFDILRQLATYVGVVLLALSIHMFIVYPAVLRFLVGRNPLAFFRGARAAIVTAFSTASSNATLPTALKVAEEDLAIPRSVARFVLTAGSTMNQNGTALFEGVTALFIAQLYGVPLGLGEQATIMGICILGGVGTAGVPAGSIPVIAMILARFGIPAEGLGLILGVDRFLDMCRTTLNVTGDLVVAAYVAKAEERRDAGTLRGA